MQNGKTESGRPYLPRPPAGDPPPDAWQERLAVLDRRIEEAEAALERLAASLAELRELRDNLVAEAKTVSPAQSATPAPPQSPVEATAKEIDRPEDAEPATEPEDIGPGDVGPADGAETPAAPLSQDEIRRLVLDFQAGTLPEETPRAAVEAEDARSKTQPRAAIKALDEADGLDGVEERLRRLVPATLRVTVEDKRNGVALVPLHRALLSLNQVDDVSLISYSGGKAVVSVSATGELDAHAAERAVSRALGRRFEISFQDGSNLLIRVSEE